MVHAVQPWDAPDSELIKGKIESASAYYRKWSYSEGQVCPHPDCDRIIRNDSVTCPEHREWHKYGESDTGAMLARHREIELLLDLGVPANVCMAWARKKVLRGRW